MDTKILSHRHILLQTTLWCKHLGHDGIRRSMIYYVIKKLTQKDLYPICFIIIHYLILSPKPLTGRLPLALWVKIKCKDKKDQIPKQRLEEKSLCLRALTAFSEDMGSIPSSYIQIHTAYNSCFRGADAFFWPPKELVTKHTHLYT